MCGTWGEQRMYVAGMDRHFVRAAAVTPVKDCAYIRGVTLCWALYLSCAVVK